MMHGAFAIVIGALVGLAAAIGVMRTIDSQNVVLFFGLWIGFAYGVAYLLAEKERT